MEISNLSDAEFKTLVMRMLKELSEDLNSIKKTQSEMKGILIEIKNNLQGNSSRVDEAENQINDLEHEEAKHIQSEQEEKGIHKKNEDSVSSLWGFRHSNIYIIGVPEGKEKEEEIGNIFEKIMEGNFPNLMKEIDIKSRNHRVPNKMDTKRPTPRHIVIKMPTVKDERENLKSSRNKAVSYLQGSFHKTISVFLKRNFVG